IGAIDRETYVLEHQLGAVAFGYILALSHHAPAGVRLGKLEMNFFLFLRDLDTLDLFQFLDTALHLLGFGGLITEAIDERLQLPDALALVAIRRLKLGAPFILLAD